MGYDHVVVRRRLSWSECRPHVATDVNVRSVLHHFLLFGGPSAGLLRHLEPPVAEPVVSKVTSSFGAAWRVVHPSRDLTTASAVCAVVKNQTAVVRVGKSEAKSKAD